MGLERQLLVAHCSLNRAERDTAGLRTAPNATVRSHEHSALKSNKQQTNLIPFREQKNTNEGGILMDTSGSLRQHTGFTKSALAVSGCPLKRRPPERV